MLEWDGWGSFFKAVASGTLFVAAQFLEQHVVEALLGILGAVLIYSANQLVQSNKELEKKVEHVMTVEIPEIKRDLAFLSGQHDSKDPHKIIRRL